MNEFVCFEKFNLVKSCSILYEVEADMISRFTTVAGCIMKLMVKGFSQ
jgi:hypothetical protein